jgi:hypothetical protein
MPSVHQNPATVLVLGNLMKRNRKSVEREVALERKRRRGDKLCWLGGI